MSDLGWLSSGGHYTVIDKDKRIMELEERLARLESAWLESEGISALGELEPTVEGVRRLIAERDASVAQLAAKSKALEKAKEAMLDVRRNVDGNSFIDE